jgi:cobalamin biosynthesis Mg chelatase CobN
MNRVIFNIPVLLFFLSLCVFRLVASDIDNEDQLIEGMLFFKEDLKALKKKWAQDDERQKKELEERCKQDAEMRAKRRQEDQVTIRIHKQKIDAVARQQQALHAQKIEQVRKEHEAAQIERKKKMKEQEEEENAARERRKKMDEDAAERQKIEEEKRRRELHAKEEREKQERQKKYDQEREKHQKKLDEEWQEHQRVFDELKVKKQREAEQLFLLQMEESRKQEAQKAIVLQEQLKRAVLEKKDLSVPTPKSSRWLLYGGSLVGMVSIVILGFLYWQSIDNQPLADETESEDAD